MAANLVSSKVKDESSPAYNTFVNKDETDGHPAVTASEAEKKTNSTHKFHWLCSFTCYNVEQCWKLCGRGTQETVSDGWELALDEYIKVPYLI